MSTTGEGSRLLGTILIAVVFFAAGWFGRGWYDGLTVSVKDASAQAQDAVDSSVVKAGTIAKAESAATGSKARAQKAIEVRYVDKECPAGTGAVSDDLAERLRVKFGPPGKDATAR
jgi:hypothetical protein